MSTRTPNIEQATAITKKGGVLLSAGAGSGKTFVIIEHIIYLLRETRSQYSTEALQKKMMHILSSITLMTFTKKAAGEMSIRLTNRVEELIDDEDCLDERPYWELVFKNLSYLKILTIHGLCHNLLRAGFWPEFPLEVDIVDKLTIRHKIKRLFDQWYDINHRNFTPQVLAHTHELFLAMEEIFQSPELRILWESPQNFAEINEELDLFFDEWIQLRSFDQLFTANFPVDSDKKKNAKKGFQAIAGFSQLASSNGKISSSNYKKYMSFFEELGRFPPASKDMNYEENNFRDEMKTLHGDIKDWGEDLLALDENTTAYKDWSKTLQSVFNYINLNYQSLSGFSYSDLEYYVHKGLKQEEALSKIHQAYTYFIVDEFQDTSFIQFDILKKLIGGDLKKLYVVGDRKQAIYGFRGGELQVFHDCERMMSLDGNLSLLSNYRSSQNIIEFNNSFFAKIFPLGFKYEELDPHHTEMEAQLVPETKGLQKGDVYSICIEVEDENADLDQYEAQALAFEIEKLVFDDSIESICVLYRKLKPSYYLIDLLKEKEISFNAQIKISYQDDPLLSMFKYLIESVLNISDPIKSSSSFFKLKALCNIIGINNFDQSEILIFIENSKLMGIMNSFIKLFLTLGLSNSFFDQNFNLLKSICEIGNNNYLQIYHILKENDDGYSTELVSGKKEKRIILMTAHASKGLEFDAVLLGGVHTNGSYQGMKAKVGKMPKSFRWKKSFDQNKFYKSPNYYLESEILKQKNFSESKRLLYVACTRAIEKLCWVDLRHNGKELMSDQNSWIKALRLAEVNTIQTQLRFHQNIHQNKISFIQKDSLGIAINKLPISTGITSELSVTRLATLAECPFKFYLKNICKINIDEKFFESSDTEEEAESFFSSKARGTAIHLILSKVFKKELFLETIPMELKEIIDWVLELARPLVDFRAISEEAIKFSFFNNMISGTPDIFFLGKDNQLVVWDFKTGQRRLENEVGYWFQLMCYAYGIGKIYPLDQEQKIKLSLIYIDEKINIAKELSLSEISRELYLVWKKTESLYQVNLSHCSVCEYSTICKKSHP